MSIMSAFHPNQCLNGESIAECLSASCYHRLSLGIVGWGMKTSEYTQLSYVWTSLHELAPMALIDDMSYLIWFTPLRLHLRKI